MNQKPRPPMPTNEIAIDVGHIRHVREPRAVPVEIRVCSCEPTLQRARRTAGRTRKAALARSNAAREVSLRRLAITASKACSSRALKIRTGRNLCASRAQIQLFTRAQTSPQPAFRPPRLRRARRPRRESAPVRPRLALLRCRFGVRAWARSGRESRSSRDL